MTDSPHILLLAGPFALRGTSAYTLRLAEHLPQHGFRVEIDTPNASRIVPKLREQLPIHEYPRLLTPLWGQLVRRWMLNDVLKEPPALIHIQSRRMLPLGTWLARRLGCPFVVTIHDFLRPRERLSFTDTQGRHIIAVSEPVQADLLRQPRLLPKWLSVIHCGVDVDAASAKPILNPTRRPVIGTAGPLEASKGLPYFLGAAQRVLATGIEAEFLVAGSGPEEANLRRLARELEIAEHVTFVPNILDLKSSLSAMDIFCLPSLRQGLGTMMLEAMALGRPVIASAVDAVETIIRDNETGLIVPPSQSEPLAQRMLELLREPFNARRIGDAARQMVQRDFHVTDMIQKTVAVYRNILEAKL